MPVDLRLLEGVKDMGFFPLRMTDRCLGKEGVAQLALGVPGLGGFLLVSLEWFV